jgi:hypothetical protein
MYFIVFSYERNIPFEREGQMKGLGMGMKLEDGGDIYGYRVHIY